MSYINLKLDATDLDQTDYLRAQLGKTRTAYIREAIQTYNAHVERDLLAQQFKEASEKCRQENAAVGRELAAAEYDLEDV